MSEYGEGGYQEVIVKQIGEFRQLVAPIDLFRAANFTRNILSGANNYTSGQSLVTVTASSVVRIKPVMVHIQNRETTHMTILFRDGSITGTVVAGPYFVTPLSERSVTADQMLGLRFVSGIYAVVISGAFSAGIQTAIGYVLEPNPNDVGGYIE